MSGYPGWPEDTDHFERIDLKPRATPVPTPAPKRSPARAGVRIALGVLTALILVVTLGVTIFREQGAAALGRLFARPASLHTTVPGPSPTPTLPRFSDDRLAYVHQDGRIHTVSLDGKTDSASQISGFAPFGRGVNIGNGKASPDGHTIYFPTDHGVALADLRVPYDPNGVLPTGRKLSYDGAWSLDNARLALGNSLVGISLVTFPSLALTPVPNLSADDPVALLGWLNPTQLAVYKYVNDELHVDALDIASGHLRLIASLPSGSLGLTQISLSPDGARVLLSNCRGEAPQFNPTFVVIDMATGHMRSIYNRTVGSCVQSIVWRPDGQMVAVTTYEQPQSANWMFDIQQGAPTAILATGNVAAWAPNGGPIIVSQSPPGQATGGPTTLLAVTPHGNQATIVDLTQNAMPYPVFGFVRTA